MITAILAGPWESDYDLVATSYGYVVIKLFYPFGEVEINVCADALFVGHIIFCGEAGLAIKFMNTVSVFDISTNIILSSLYKTIHSSLNSVCFLLAMWWVRRTNTAEVT